MVMWTSMLPGTPTLITKLIVIGIKVTGRIEDRSAKEAVAIGSMMRATGKAFLTAIREQLRSITGEHLLRPRNHERPTAAEPSRAGRTFPGVAGTEGAVVLRIEGVLNRGAARALLEEASGAVTSGNKATAVAQAVRV
jgi:hypothetical protein